MYYIIEIDDKSLDKGKLYRAKEFNTLVFDQRGLEKLQPLRPKLDAEKKKGYEQGIQSMYNALKTAYERDCDKSRIAPSIKQFVLNHSAEEFIAAIYRPNKCDECVLRNEIAKVFDLHWLGEDDCPVTCPYDQKP